MKPRVNDTSKFENCALENLCYHWYCTISSWIVNIFQKIFFHKSKLITHPIGFDIGLTKVTAMLKQRCDNVTSTLIQGWNEFKQLLHQHWARLYQCCCNIKKWRSINVVFHCNSYVGFCFIFNKINVILTFQHWTTTLKQLWSNAWPNFENGDREGFVSVFLYKLMLAFWYIIDVHYFELIIKIKKEIVINNEINLSLKLWLFHFLER